MRKMLLLLLALLMLTTSVFALEIPDSAREYLPHELVESVEREDSLLSGGWAYLCDTVRQALTDVLRSGVRSCAMLMLLSLLCGAVEGLSDGAGADAVRFVPYFGVLGASLLTAGDLAALIGLGAQTVDELGVLGKLLIPTVAAAMAAGGCVGTASLWQVGTLLVSDVLLTVTREVLLPLVYCYIALAAAGALLPKAGLDVLAGGVKKLLSWGVCGVTLLFTAFLTVSNVLTGSADKAAVKAGSFVISNAVPVVGGILSEATEAVLAGAGALRGTVGTLGVFAVLAVCAVPLLRFAVQFLFYQAAAFLSAMAGCETLQKFINRLSGAFTLVLALTASCAAILLVALLVAMTMVTV